MNKRKRDELSEEEESSLKKEEEIGYKKDEKGKSKKGLKKDIKPSNSEKKTDNEKIHNKKKGKRKKGEDKIESENESEKEENNKKANEYDLIENYKNKLREIEKEMEEVKKENEYLKLQLENKNKEKNSKKKSNEKIETIKNSKYNINSFDDDIVGDENKISSIKQPNIIHKKKDNIQEQNINQKGEVFHSIKSYPNPTLIGLQNIGATCFMNATLQCLSQTKGLTNYFLKEGNLKKIINNNIAISNPKDFQISPVYHELIQNLWKYRERT